MTKGGGGIYVLSVVFLQPGPEIYSLNGEMQRTAQRTYVVLSTLLTKGCLPNSAVANASQAENIRQGLGKKLPFLENDLVLIMIHHFVSREGKKSLYTGITDQRLGSSRPGHYPQHFF